MPLLQPGHWNKSTTFTPATPVIFSYREMMYGNIHSEQIFAPQHLSSCDEENAWTGKKLCLATCSL
ncbi:wsv505 [White spot syndrome virus]|uniref:Wsv505 n=4 Tax=White spot syndrome virus TaxID=342409 RepID=Q8VAC0_WSSVS|nr:wsv505 [Shrimp white spot syndrome virus]AFX59867.1 wsv505 [White spot syndrome virus]AAL33506.1 wsv505 [Shrimp white spot syndrome virus]AWQ60602.1 wsv505 [Shrimp white spot syndrome virus]AWQ61039.1 wsv505 [Shrimp white spot syndrome virus]AWQ61434.1 wsv505 [Shrimp white spot syndrome virus]